MAQPNYRRMKIRVSYGWTVTVSNEPWKERLMMRRKRTKQPCRL